LCTKACIYGGREGGAADVYIGIVIVGGNISATNTMENIDNDDDKKQSHLQVCCR
jgi:hypothetical protein